MCIIAVIIFASVRKIWVEDRKNFSVSDMSNVIIDKNEATVYIQYIDYLHMCSKEIHICIKASYKHRIIWKVNRCLCQT